MRDLRRLVVLGVLAIVAFIAALVTFDDDAEAGCVSDADADPAYTVQLEGEPVTGQGEYRLLVTRDGARVAGARVCLTAAMEGMAAMGVSAETTEVEAGVYQLTLDFPMAGPWEGTVVVSERGRSAVAVPLSIDVE